MKVLTYSNSISMIGCAAASLDDLEVVFGREDIIRGFGPYLTLQKDIITGLKAEVRGRNLLEQKVASGELRFFTVKDAISHEMLYLLEGPKGVRVITGSANFSETAFSGSQNESIICFDNDEAAWEVFNAKYEKIKARSALPMPKRAVLSERFGEEDILILSDDDSAQKITEIREGPPPQSVVHK